MGNALSNNFCQADSIYVQLDNPVATSGQLVSGNVYLNINNPTGFQSKGVFLEVEGYEETRFTTEEFKEVEVDGERRQERVDVQRRERKHFLHFRIPLHSWSALLMPGQYVFPFSFLLPQNLPGSFHEEDVSRGWGDYMGQIFYRIEAECDHGGFFQRDIKNSQNLVVHQHLLTEIQPTIVNKNANVKVCCCIDKGRIEMTASFDKNAYQPGETAFMMVAVNNQSDVDVRSMHCKLKRRIHLRAYGYTFQKTEVLQDLQHQGVPAHEVRSGDNSIRMELPLTDSRWGMIQPGARGELVTCEYWLEVECDIPWAPDVVIHLPVTIYHPPSNMIIPKTPQGWHPTQVFEAQSYQNVNQYSIIGSA